MTNPTPHGQVPAIQRYSIGYHSDEWGVRSLSPTGIYDDAGPWVRYEDHVTALAAGQATAAQPCAPTPAELACRMKWLAAEMDTVGSAMLTQAKSTGDAELRSAGWILHDAASALLASIKDKT